MKKDWQNGPNVLIQHRDPCDVLSNLLVMNL